MFDWGRHDGVGKLDSRQAGLGELSGDYGFFIYGFYALDADTSPAYRRELTATASLGFGGGTRGSPIPTYIKLNEFNGSLHIVDTNASAPNDTCPSPHLHIIKKALSTDDGCYVDDSDIIILSYGIPHPGQGLMMEYSTSQTLTIISCEIWAGTGESVINPQEDAQFWFTELGYYSTFYEWKKSFYDDRLALHSADNKTGQNFYWYFGVSVLPTAVGFNNKNKIKSEIVYE